MAASCLIRGWRGLEGSHVMTREDGWVGSIYGRLGMRATSSLTAKLWAIHVGLILAKKYDLKKVIIKTDSSKPLKWLCLTSSILESHPDRVVIEECKSLISELRIVLIHNLRQENNCADYLATLGRIQQEDMVIIDRPPHSV
ncbi:hypothetical protein KY290_029383 [Solanum tuberosum]|uniref:RNase H type-1 domain-containing protein n=1 Tax=Solanum tuberosum TaxID=4113 RepID=A0ABQ7UKK7_SOLTU|nr:hypothetical protein KY290_029383 [Solanum tuberosum]